MNLGASASLQARSIFALMLRRIRSRYLGSRAGYMWAFVEPIVWVFVLKIALHATSGSPPIGTSYEVFFVGGIVIARTWRSIVTAAMGALMRAKRQSLPTLHRMDAVYAIWLLEVVTGGIVMIIALAVLQLFGHDAAPGNLLICIVAYMAMALFALGFAMVFALIVTVAPGLDHFRSIFLLIVFFTSGFSLVVDRMPPSLRAAVVWNPLLHCVEWFREGFYTGYECRALDLVYLFSVCVGLILFGLAGERALRRRNKKGPVLYSEDDV